MKQKGNMYEWAKPWNPLGGKCMHDCSYCSTNSLKRYPVINEKYSGEIRLYSDLFKIPKNKPIIFVVAQNDLFANNVPTQYVMRVLQACRNDSSHIYFFQTKNPDRYLSFLPDFPKGSILCTTIETNRNYPLSFAPLTADRAEAMYKITGYEKQVTIEPILDFDLEEMITLIKMCHPSKVNIGADSKNNHLPEPSKEKLLALIDELQKFTIIDRKTNLSRLLK
jgi:DNA repair photolyase